jgi:hypothetical protein
MRRNFAGLMSQTATVQTDSTSDWMLLEAQLPPSLLALSCIHLACTSHSVNLTSSCSLGQLQTIASSPSVHMCDSPRACVCVCVCGCVCECVCVCVCFGAACPCGVQPRPQPPSILVFPMQADGRTVYGAQGVLRRTCGIQPWLQPPCILVFPIQAGGRMGYILPKVHCGAEHVQGPAPAPAPLYFNISSLCVSLHNLIII